MGRMGDGSRERTRDGSAPPGEPPAKGMRWIPMGEFTMGSADFYPEEAPVTHVALDGFWKSPPRA